MIKRARGFTLLEMLLVLGLVAVLMLTLMQLLSQTATIWGDSNEEIQRIENDELALSFIRKMFDRTTPVNWDANETGLISKAFLGKEKQLYFVAPLPISAAEHLGLYLYSLSVEKSPTQVNHALVISYWPFNPASLEKTLESERRHEVIMTDVAAITFRYFGDKDYSDGLDTPIWHDNWEAAGDLPLAVQLSIRRTPPDHTDDTAVPRLPWHDLTFNLLQRSLR